MTSLPAEKVQKQALETSGARYYASCFKEYFLLPLRALFASPLPDRKSTSLCQTTKVRPSKVYHYRRWRLLRQFILIRVVSCSFISMQAGELRGIELY
ncbi:hypothetical protein AVEN_38560-1 [Araneus ventricosus]|uniref:Uncharacterized protein n=1 Tax=Araneus ventricosus TaxID=182803 RepID=A0A4Y2N0W2_ARAVE|nr:hypothetical protein AVEN_38560-1 [Araneus ventricosus]